MKKVLSYILITVITLANILAPISVGWGSKNNSPAIERNVVEAVNINLQLRAEKTDETITGYVDAIWDGEITSTTFEHVYLILETEGKDPVIHEVTLNKPSDAKNIYKRKGKYTFEDLTPKTKYKLTAVANQTALNINKIIRTIATVGIYNLFEGTIDSSKGEARTESIPITTSIKGQTKNVSTGNTTANHYDSNMPICGVKVAGVGRGSLGGCLAQGIYYLFFMPSSFLFGLAGTFFDNTFAYSVNDQSYRSAFVVEGWKIVRDFCNMFFIFILLYISFKTILDLGASKTKEMIINVVIIGLLINFSLFATRVIIDTSNILARVFYNSNTIKITAVDKGIDAYKIVKKADKNGVLPISAALVNKVDPQSLIINAKKINNISDKAGQTTANTDKTSDNGVSTSTFIIITLLATGINIVGFIVFLTVGLIFVTRVIGLWLAMILAPLAFFSYTVPAMQGIDTIGWKKWWPETLSLAFVAPVFIFFMYLILKFLQKGLGVLSAQDKNGLEFVIVIVIPFAFIMVLLTKAKKIAIKMSGEMGAAVSKAGSAVGGIALGAATGGAAMAMRGTIGAHANKIANDEQLQKDSLKGGFKGFKAKMQLRAASGLSKSNFDFRNTKAGSLAGKGLDVDLGKGKTGGFSKYKEDKDKKRKEKVENIKKIATPKEKVELDKAQIDLKETMLAMKPELDELDKKIKKTRQEMRDANDGMNSVLANKKLRELKILQSQRDETKNSTAKILSWKTTTDSDGYTINVADTYGPDFKDSNGDIIKTIKNAEDAEEKAKNNLEKAKNKIVNKYADDITSKSNKILNTIASLGQDRGSSVEETAQDVRVGDRVEKDKGDTGK